MVSRFLYRPAIAEYTASIKGLQKPIAQASTAAVHEAGEIARREGRANIAAARFPTRWQNALVVDFFPQGNQVSLTPSAVIRHRFGLAGVFETGAVIQGRPLLWLPLRSVPLGPGGHPLTPKQYVARIGPLASVRARRGRPLLVGKGRRGSAGPNIPLFVGVPSVNIRKRFDIIAIVRRAADRLGEFYLKNLKAD